MNHKTFILGFLTVVFTSLTINAQFHFETYALQNVNIIDVNTQQILSDYTIVIHKDLISNILPSKDYVSNDSIQSINTVKGKFVVPGLIDAHVHFATDPTAERRDEAEKVLQEMLLSGITSVRDMAGDTRALSSLSRDAWVGDIDAPNIYYSSLMAGTTFFADPRTIASAQGGKSGEMPYMKAIDDNSNISLEVAQAIGTGAHGIKLYANLTPKQINKIVEEAKKQHIPVWSHAAHNPTKPSEIIPSGVISVSHANLLLYENVMENKELVNSWKAHEATENDALYWDEEFNALDFSNIYNLMIKYDVVFDPTLTVFERYNEKQETKWLYQISKRMIKQAHEAGVKVAAGSDSDQATFVQYEMKLLVNESDFSPMDALVSATKYAAMATGILKDEGTIEKGKKANLLFLNSNPIDNVDHIDTVYLVIKNGKLYNSN
ncbi:amidohydrolase family protein [Bizionia arctica]|uniref:Amidohydrolase n=1 Tax=Bizionia arctica TaxID=1495645 RepID=A0A917GG78_9FLAO|nr:amidohydrolase family protein [Bizionia arctica]GGG43632.1 amidohydrolase [Bizionia arctica]